MRDGTIVIGIPLLREDHCRNYFDALSRLGARGEVIHAECDPADYDGLLLPGGGDVEPALYGQAMSPDCDPPDLALDRLQLGQLERFVRARRPVLGICRGIQVINVCFGGTLIQHLPGCARHSRMGQPADKVHATRAARGSVPEQLYGMDFSTNSNHHQAVDRLGEGLVAVQWADDGVVEAVWHRTLPVYGVQWHPERMCFANARTDTVDGAKLFQWFLRQCAKGEDG